MVEKYYDLISLIANNREAMDYFKSLPEHVKSQISRYPGRINSIDGLRNVASGLLKGYRE